MSQHRASSALIAHIMPLATDPRINRRLRAARQLGIRQVAFSFQRESFAGSTVEDAVLTSLGFVHHGRYLRRVLALGRALGVLLRHASSLRKASVIYAFGTDCMVLAVVASLVLRISRTPIVYEIADVRGVMLGSGVRARCMRLVERWGMRRVRQVVVTSTRYRDEYLVGMQRFPADRVQVVENKLFPPVPAPHAVAPWTGARPAVIGCFGLIRFQESWDALVALAKRYPDRLSVYIRGFPMGIHGFEEDIGACDNITFGGAYSSPDELAEIYGCVDVAWVVYGVGDDQQRKWMLPNRFFESIYYGVPQVANRGSLLSARIDELGIGYSVEVADPRSIDAFVAALTPESHGSMREQIQLLPADFALGMDDNLQLMRHVQDLHWSGSPPSSLGCRSTPTYS